MRAPTEENSIHQDQVRGKEKKKGIALITVLFVLSLMVVLVLAILSTSVNELNSATRTASGVRVKDLTNTVTSLAIGQLRKATSPPDSVTQEGGGNSVGDGLWTWVSQPGMVTHFDDSGATQAFKLYSSDISSFPTAEGGLSVEIDRERREAANWSRETERWANLNEPFVRYDETGQEERFFPILDPRAQFQDQVEGFDIDISAVPGGGNTGSRVAAGEALPMPVKWLYMLKDGSLGTLNRSGKYGGEGAATQENPIVARVAYWIDDESNKININTASEAAYWDIPKTTTEDAKGFAEFQPSQSEIHRFSGHPYSTCLSSVFFPDRYYDPPGLEKGEGPDSENGPLTLDELEAIVEMSPKQRWGGSKGGTFDATQQDQNERLGFDSTGLYSSVDEMFFKANRSENRLFNLVAENKKEAVRKLDSARGFLTAHSRSPELNVFGRPRAAIWPLERAYDADQIEDGWHPFDRALAFAATMEVRGPALNDQGIRFSGGDGATDFLNDITSRQFFFQRISAGAYESDFFRLGARRNNVRLYQYLMDQVYSPLPTYGASLSQKYGVPADREKFQYDIGGQSPRRNPFPDRFLDPAQIGAQIFDHIRTANIHNANVRRPFVEPTNLANDYYGQVSSSLLARSPALYYDQGGGAPFAVDHTDEERFPKGFGRNYTISEVALVIFCSAEGRVSAPGRLTNLRGGRADRRQLERHPEAMNPDNVGKELRYLQVGMLLELFSPSHGFRQIHPKMAVRMLTGGRGYENSWGNTARRTEENDGRASVRYGPELGRVDTRRFKGYTNYSGYKLAPVSGNITGFENPITYWGTAEVNPQRHGNTNGPMVQTNPVRTRTNSEYVGVLPSAWRGWGGSGGYRLLRFGAQWTDQFDTDKMTNRDNQKRIRGMYAQHPIVIAVDGQEPKMRLIPPEDGGPIKFLTYVEGDSRIDLAVLHQTIEVKFPEIRELPVPELNQGDFQGWGRRLNRAADDAQQADILSPRDLVISMIPKHGDYRHIAARKYVPHEMWTLHPKARNLRGGQGNNADNKAHSLVWANPDGARGTGPGRRIGRPAVSRRQLGSATGTSLEPLVSGIEYPAGKRPDFAGLNSLPLVSDPTAFEFSFDPGDTRDWDNGVGSAPDGAYINKADDGAESQISQVPYFEPTPAPDLSYIEELSFDNTFSPNRVMPSPGIFGSLPSLVQAGIPWNTLLFRPDLTEEKNHFGARGHGIEEYPGRYTSSGESPHSTSAPWPVRSVVQDTPGSVLPPDHMWLDLFWMPVVEPYPVSEAFSTAGKVNMNYRMVPFDYIERSTALRAVLKSERVLAIPNTAADEYKNTSSLGSVNYADTSYYRKIDADKTLQQFEKKFDDGELFVTESEICEQFLYPFGNDAPEYDEEADAIRDFWNDHRLTGDNSLERPYTNIYPRLTTRSNVFRVHMTVQTLRKVRGTDVSSFDEEGGDRVAGEYRGSAVIERYLDPQRRDLPDYLVMPDETTEESDSQGEGLNRFYEYRVVNVKQFAP